jgi:hypothetical protein
VDGGLIGVVREVTACAGGDFDDISLFPCVIMLRSVTNNKVI